MYYKVIGEYWHELAVQMHDLFITFSSECKIFTNISIITPFLYKLVFQY